ncbi:outer membrane lipoprotein-sorting protein [uncultured Desulfuromonas sp.]|uniref:outer membrane lipoprotein-sorting protein n=1 Tax=uncultured Desulfuromonas sp. TaxID=181013 RepID=UPI002AAB4606|nr:outer membrane lipoprotein-sorting protein [uncultured Desulfuromonas sp.]
MKYILKSIPGYIFVLITLLSLSVAYATSTLEAKQVAENVYHRDVGSDLQMTGAMELISKSGHVRHRGMTTLRRDTECERRVLIRFTSPADIRDTAFLVVEDAADNTTQQHLYLPALKRTRRIVASQQGRNFVNSDFTYEDMQRHPVAEWDYALKAPEPVLGYDCYVLVSTPKPETETQYGKIISWIEKEHFIPLRTLFWNKKGEQTKTYTVEKIALIDGIATEMSALMEDHSDQHQTRMTTHSAQYNTGLPARFLTTRALEP